jgi:hypothetical protein
MTSESTLNINKYTPWKIINYIKPYPNTQYNPTLDIVLIQGTLNNTKLQVIAVGGGFFGYEIHTIDMSNSIDSGNIFYSQFDMIPITLEQQKESIETFLDHVPLRWISEEKRRFSEDFKKLMNMISPDLSDAILQKLLPERSMR